MQTKLIDFYRSEYELDANLTIDGLKAKYNLTDEDIGDTSTWKKQLDVEVITDSRPLAPAKKPIQTLASEAPSSVQQDIESFKRAVVTEALHRIKWEASSIDTKSLKELASIVDMIERSYKGTQDGQQVNVLIQNIVNNFKDDV